MQISTSPQPVSSPVPGGTAARRVRVGARGRGTAAVPLVVVGAVVAATVVRTARTALRDVASLRETGALVPPLLHDATFPGAAPPCHLTVLGDSAAAGHGLPHADDGLARHLAWRLVVRTGREVAVTSLAVDGATTADVVTDQVPDLAETAEIVLVGVGVNDAIRGRSPRHVRRATHELLDAIERRAPGATVVLLACPDLAAAPGLPRVMAPPLGWSCRQVARAQTRVARHLGVVTVPAGGRLPAAAFGPDGFHPGPMGVAALAERVDRVLAVT